VIHRIRTIDAHAAGEPLRLVVEGMPAPEGRTMLEKRAWAMKRLDHLRKALILEPRGHTDMYGALLTEPTTAEFKYAQLARARVVLPDQQPEAMFPAVRLQLHSVIDPKLAAHPQRRTVPEPLFRVGQRADATAPRAWRLAHDLADARDHAIAEVVLERARLLGGLFGRQPDRRRDEALDDGAAALLAARDEYARTGQPGAAAAPVFDEAVGVQAA